MEYIIETRNVGEAHAGAKAPDDIVSIARKRGMGVFTIPVLPNKTSRIYILIWLFIICTKLWARVFLTVKNGDIVVWQHPAYGIRYANYFIPWIKKRKKVTFVALIHDLESLREGIGSYDSKDQSRAKIADNSLLSKFDYVISHNKKMTAYLLEQGFESNKLINLGVFDYLDEGTPNLISRINDKSVIIAGNLSREKSAYIYDLKNLNVDLRLYGMFFEGDENDSAYKGTFRPDQLIEHLEGAFGLVWDGNSLEECAGNTGQYLKYNNPHKTSLYLAAQLPVIIWSQAALADFVEENGVGIVIDDLNHLEVTLAKVTDDQYTKMLDNIEKISKKVKAGHYFSVAMDQTKH